MNAARESLLLFTLLELTIIVIAGRVGGALAARCGGQTAAVGEIIIGILLGPSLFGALAPHAFQFIFKSAPAEPLLVLSQLGLVLLMFQIGLEFDFAHLRERVNRAAIARVAIAGLVLPFASGFVIGYWQPWHNEAAPRLNGALFVATAFSITALPILGRIMVDFGLARSRLGAVVIAAAAVNDVVGWLLLTLITALSVSRFVGAEFALRTATVALFALLSVKLVRPLLKRAIRRSNATSGSLSPNLLGVMLAVILTAAVITSRIGIFAIFGGFMMGVILYDEPEFVAAWRDRVGTFVTVFFLPIFFTYTGLRTSIGRLDSAADWLWCLGIIATASLSKFLSAYVAARRSGFAHAQSAMIGFMMNTRALMELIVINVGLDLGVISAKMFTALVLMAIVSTVLTTPALRYYLSRGARTAIDLDPLRA